MVRLLSSLLRSTDIETTETTFKLSSQHEWLSEHFEYFFKQYQPFILYSLDKFSKSNSEFTESFLVIIYYMIASIPLIDLIEFLV